MLSNNRNKAILALIVANAIWGAGSPIFKLALQNIGPFTLAYLRFLGGAVILLPLAYNAMKINKKDWISLFLLSFFGITINITFFFLGLRLAPSINAPIIGTSGPIFLYLFSLFIIHEKPHSKLLAGIIISLLGVFVIVGQPFLSGSDPKQILGNFFFILATLGSVVHAIVGKKILQRYSAVAITCWSFIIGALTFLPFFFFELTISDPFRTIDIRGITGIIFGILFSSASAYLLYDWGIKKVETQEIGLFSYIDPITAALIAVVILGEAITPIFIFGSILIFLGIYIAEGRINYHPFHKLTK